MRSGVLISDRMAKAVFSGEVIFKPRAKRSEEAGYATDTEEDCSQQKEQLV